MGLRPISTRFSARPPKQNSSSAELGTVAFCAMTGRSTSGNDSAVPAGLGARPRIRRGRVPSAAGAAARRRDAGDVSAHRRGAPTQQMPRGAGTQRAHGGCTAIAALLVVNDAQRHHLLLAPCARRASPMRATPFEHFVKHSVPHMKRQKLPDSAQYLVRTISHMNLAGNEAPRQT